MVANDGFSMRVAPQEAGVRLDALLARHLNHCSRSYAARLIRRGHVQVDGLTRKPSYQVKTDEAITGQWPAPAPTELLAESIPLDILFEDRHLIVVNKPPGLVVHPAAGHASGTLVNALLYRCPDLEGIGGEKRPGIVHRLDKDTSGALVVAKTAKAHEALSTQFKERSIQKQYLGLVLGDPKHDHGKVDLPIGRHPVDRKKMVTRESGGREALTLWRVEERFQGAALLRFDLKTGRTHQIRVHCRAMGHPIVGDVVYGRRRRIAKANPHLSRAVRIAERQMLHAHRIGFTHPASDAFQSFQAPVPKDMEAVLAAFKQLP